MKTSSKLAVAVWAQGIHGITGKPVDWRILEPGTLVRNVRETGEVHPLDGKPWIRFEASTDGGEAWYTHETCGKVRCENA